MWNIKIAVLTIFIDAHGSVQLRIINVKIRGRIGSTEMTHDFIQNSEEAAWILKKSMSLDFL